MNVPTERQVAELALEYFHEAGMEVVAGEGVINSVDGRVFGLGPLQRRLADLPADEWKAMVTRQFDLLLGVEIAYPVTFGAARPLLRSAVVSDLDMGLFDGALKERALVDGLGERLMLRRGDLGMTVTAEVVEGWGVDDADVWDAARSGSLWDEPVQHVTFGHGDGGFTAVRGGRWTSTRILDIGRYLRPPVEFGALVAVPARDEILFHQIRSADMGPTAVTMLQYAIESFRSSPHPVGCDLFFWNAGSISRIVTPGDDGFIYLRVPEFSAALWNLEQRLRNSVVGG